MNDIFKKGVMVAFIGMLAITANSQQVRFAATGELTNIPLKSADFTKMRISAEQDPELKKSSDELLKNYRKTVMAKIEETVKVLEDTSAYIRTFYTDLWGGNFLAQYKNDLDSIQKALTGNNLIDVNKLHFLKQLAGALNSHLLGGNQFVYDLDTTTNSIDLIAHEKFNQFVLDYYEKSVVDFPLLTAEHHISLTARLRHYIVLADTLLRGFRDLKEGYNPRLYRKMDTFSSTLRQWMEERGGLKSYVKGNWFKNWLWFRGGILKFNPLDFTTDELLRNEPAFDVIKSVKFDTYINEVIERYIKLDTFGTRINDYKKILAQQGTGNTVFSFKNRLDSIQQVNDAFNKKILVTKRTLNKVKIPAAGSFFTFSATGALVNDSKESDALVATLKDGQTKTMVLHNIPAGAKGVLSEKSSFLLDRSLFQQGMDDVFGQIGELAKLVSTLSGYTGLLDQFLPKSFPKPTAINSDGQSLISSNCSLWNKMENSILTRGTDVDTIFFRQAFEALQRSTGTDCPPANKLPEALNAYYKLLDEYRDTMYARLQKDSADMKVLTQIFLNSSMPVKKLTPRPEKEPAFYSSILTTKAIDSTKKQTVTILAVKGKDSTEVHKFSYNVGKRKYVQLSAGLAYTFTPFSQTEATAENGGITIKNKAQQYRLVAGLSVYPGGLVSVRNEFISPANWKERLHLFIGVGIPRPLDNIYLGPGWDFGPGLRLVGGWHIIRQNQYEIINNVITEERRQYKSGGLFVSLQIDPVSLIKLFDAFTKK